MNYTRHEMQDASPRSFAVPLFWSRLIEATGEQSALTKRQCRELMRAYCCTLPYFETDKNHSWKMIEDLNGYLTVPVDRKTLADLAGEGEDFYDREKPSIGRLEDYVRKGAGFHEERLAVFTIEFWVSARSFADNREKLEELLLRSGFYPLYKD